MIVRAYKGDVVIIAETANYRRVSLTVTVDANAQIIEIEEAEAGDKALIELIFSSACTQMAKAIDDASRKLPLGKREVYLEKTWKIDRAELKITASGVVPKSASQDVVNDALQALIGMLKVRKR